MQNHKIDFNHIPWDSPAEGVKQKTASDGNQMLRLIQFHSGFEEKDWCEKGHIGYVVEGAMKISFNGKVNSYKSGDAFIINRGKKEKHKVIIEDGGFVELLVVESLG